LLIKFVCFVGGHVIAAELKVSVNCHHYNPISFLAKIGRTGDPWGLPILQQTVVAQNFSSKPTDGLFYYHNIKTG
jgi:hypothetical protein